MMCSERETTSIVDFSTVLGEQKLRVLAALEEREMLEATPIVHDGEIQSCEEYETLVYELHHVHLPEMMAEGLIEFDRGEDEVIRGPRFHEICPHLSNNVDEREGRFLR